MEKINEYAMKRDFIRSISEKTGAPAGYILIGLVLIVLVLLYSGIGGLFAVLILGFLYPAYMTFKALKHSNHELLIKFGKFWAVMGFAVALHEVIDWLAPEFPFFELLTIASTFMLVKSQASAAVYIYDTLIVPCVGKVEPNIDSALSTVEARVKKDEDALGDIKAKMAEAMADPM